MGIAVKNACGSCRACCRALGIEELDKPEWSMCSHAKQGKGCTIYADRPHSCKLYECMWRSSQDEGSPWPSKMRPDRCGVIFDTLLGNPSNLIVARVAPEHEPALQTPLIMNVIGAMKNAGADVIVRLGKRTSNPVNVVEMKK
jgi:hypothetical protein